jgi:hypothetical protein
MAALATIPGREEALALCLASLRPQVEYLAVVCHDVLEPPACVRELADEFACEPDTAGSAAGLRWAGDWEGLYLKCDDDFEYPENYVAEMLRWVKRWKGKALVACHGRRLIPKADLYIQCDLKASPQEGNGGAFINYPGACAIAWDTRLQVPPRIPEKNLEEPYLARWAQERHVPIWLVPKEAGWLKYLLNGHEGPTIWSKEKAEGFKDRNRLISEQTARAEWRVFRA